MAAPKLRFKEFDGDWSETSIGKLTKYFKGYAFKSESYKESGRRIIRVSDLGRDSIKYDNDAIFLDEVESSNYKDWMLKKDDIVITTVGSKPHLVDSAVGRPIYIRNNNEGLLNQNLLVLRPINQEVEPYFIFAQLLDNKYLTHIETIQRGNANQSNITVKDLQEFRVFSAQKIEQTKIASFLSAVDEKISQLTQKHELLSQYKQGMMQKLFSQQIRFKADDGSEFGEWEEKTIQYFLDQNYILDQMDGNHGELYPKSEEFSDSGIPYIGATDFSNGAVNFLSCKKIPLGRALKFKKGIAKNGDVLFAHNATVGPVALLITDLEFVILSTTATYYRCNPKKIINIYLKSALESDYFKKQYVGIMSQSTRNQVPITTQRKLNLVVPCLEEQTKIANFLSAIDQKIEVVAQQIEQAKQWKKGLLQQMFV